MWFLGPHPGAVSSIGIGTAGGAMVQVPEETGAVLDHGVSCRAVQIDNRTHAAGGVGDVGIEEFALRLRQLSMVAADGGTYSGGASSANAIG